MATKPVNLETASFEELKTLDQIGDARAQALIDLREQRGGKITVTDLLQMPNVPATVWKPLMDQGLVVCSATPGRDHKDPAAEHTDTDTERKDPGEPHKDPAASARRKERHRHSPASSRSSRSSRSSSSSYLRLEAEKYKQAWEYEQKVRRLEGELAKKELVEQERRHRQDKTPSKPSLRTPTQPSKMEAGDAVSSQVPPGGQVESKPPSGQPGHTVSGVGLPKPGQAPAITQPPAGAGCKEEPATGHESQAVAEATESVRQPGRMPPAATRISEADLAIQQHQEQVESTFAELTTDGRYTGRRDPVPKAEEPSRRSRLSLDSIPPGIRELPPAPLPDLPPQAERMVAPPQPWQRHMQPSAWGVEYGQTGQPATMANYPSNVAQSNPLYRPRPERGPPPPKTAVYDGKQEWRPFALQFDIAAKRYGWSDQDKLDA